MKFLLLLLLSTSLVLAEPVSLVGTVEYKNGLFNLLVVDSPKVNIYRMDISDPKLETTARNLAKDALHGKVIFFNDTAKVTGDLRGDLLMVRNIEVKK